MSAGKGVFTRSLRFGFVNGQISDTPDSGFVACGDGREFCMEVEMPGGLTIHEKFDIISEIFYRVKDAVFTSGTAVLAGDETSQIYHAPTTHPTNRFHGDSVLSGVIRRGYTTESEIPPAVVPAYNDPFLGEEYDRGDSVMCRDIGANEAGMWIRGEANVSLPYWNGVSGWFGPVCVNAFSFESSLYGPSDPYSAADTDYFQVEGGGAFVDPCFGSVAFSGQIAVVKVNPEDGLFAATNRYFIGLNFIVTGGQYPNDFWISTQKNDWDLEIYPEGKNVECCDYVIKLSGDRQLSCPVYGVAAYDFPYGETFSGSDFIHEAVEWWPHAKQSPAVPVWNTTTGAKL